MLVLLNCAEISWLEQQSKPYSTGGTVLQKVVGIGRGSNPGLSARHTPKTTLSSTEPWVMCHLNMEPILYLERENKHTARSKTIIMAVEKTFYIDLYWESGKRPSTEKRVFKYLGIQHVHDTFAETNISIVNKTLNIHSTRFLSIENKMKLGVY